MRVIFITSVIFFINFGLAVCMLKLKRLNNLEKTFIELNKRCVQLTGVAKYEYLWQIEAEFKTEIYSLKEAVIKLREIYQERLDMAEENYRIVLKERLIESEHKYKIKEIEATELNIENKRLNTVFAKLEVINENDNITIESKNGVSLLAMALIVFLAVLGVFTIIMLRWFFIEETKAVSMDSSNIDLSSSIEYPDGLWNNQHEMRKPNEMPFDKRTEIDDRMACVQNDNYKTQNIISLDKEVSCCIENRDKLLQLIKLREMRDLTELLSNDYTQINDRMACFKKKNFRKSKAKIHQD